jgi:hypothetical protein
MVHGADLLHFVGHQSAPLVAEQNARLLAWFVGIAATQ